MVIRRHWLPAVVVVLVTLAPYHAVIFGGRTLSVAASLAGSDGMQIHPGAPRVPEDNTHIDRGASVWQFEPWAQVVHRSLRNGELPLWNPYEGAGAPLAANFQSAAFDPLLLPVNLDPSQTTWDMAFLLAFVVMALGGYWLGIVLDLDRWAAAFLGMAFPITGWFFLYSGNSYIRAYAYLPLLFGGIELVTRGRTRAGIVVVALATAGTAFVGMPEITAVVVAFAGLLAVVRTGLGRDKARLRGVMSVALGVAIGGFLAGPLLLPGAEYLRLAHSSHGSGAGVGTQRFPLDVALNWIVPFFNGQPVHNSLGIGGTVRDWVGAGIASLAVAALAVRDSTRSVLAYGAVAALAVAKMYGVPGVNLLGRAPGFDRISFPFVVGPIAALAMVVMAAICIDGMRRGALDRARALVTVAAGVVVMIALVVAPLNRRFIDAMSSKYVVRQFGLAGLVVLAVIVAISCRWRWAPLAVVVVTMTELFLLAPVGMFNPKSDPYGPPQWMHLVDEGLGNDRLARVFGTDGKLYPDISGAFGKFDIRALDGLYVDRYFTYIKNFIAPSVTDRFVGGVDGEGPSRIVANPMADLLGVKVVVTQHTLPGTPLHSQVAGAVAATPSAGAGADAVTVGGDTRDALYIEPGQEVTLPARPPGATQLAFSYGLDDRAWNDATSPATRFVVVGMDGGGHRTELWSDTVVPGGHPRTPAWTAARVLIPADVSEVRLMTDTGGRPLAGKAAWATYGFEPAGAAPVELVHFVGRTGTGAVYTNMRARPRAWLVSGVAAARNADDAVRQLRSRGTRDPSGGYDVMAPDPASDPVIEAPARQVEGRGCTDPGTATITRYDMLSVHLRADARCPTMLVLSDTYYPGWTAKVNGKPAPILAADVALRAIAVPVGRSDVEIRYVATTFRLGTVGHLLGLVALVAVLLAPTRWRRLRDRSP